MRKTLATLAAISALNGCAGLDLFFGVDEPQPNPPQQSPIVAQPAPLPQEPPRQNGYTVKDVINGHRTDYLTQARAPHSLSTVVLAGTEYAVERNKIKQAGELEFTLRSYKESILFSDDSDKVVNIESTNLYVPTRHMVPNLAASPGTSPCTKPASKAYFNTTGPYAVKAQINGASKADGLAVRTRTQDDGKFELRTIEIDRRSFYVPITIDNATGNIQDTFLVPVEGTQRGINQENGQIILRNPGNIYRLKAVRQDEYNTRTLPAITPELIGTPAAEIK